MSYIEANGGLRAWLDSNARRVGLPPMYPDWIIYDPPMPDWIIYDEASDIPERVWRTPLRCGDPKCPICSYSGDLSCG